MRSKGFKTILLFLALGFLIIWILEFRRTSLADSYWLLLVVLTFVFWYQLLNLKKKDEKIETDDKKLKGKRGKKV